MTPRSESAEQEFGVWLDENPIIRLTVPHEVGRLRAAFTAGWHAALAAQEQAHAEATRRIEEGMR